MSSVFDWNQGDVIVCRLGDERTTYVTQDHIERTKVLLEEGFLGHKAIVLGPGASLEIVTPTDA